MYSIESDQLKISINAKGAEIKSIVHQQYKLEYMWSGDPAFWSKTSPVLFPVVGALKENKFLYKEQAYSLSRHGFARDEEFSVTAHQQDAITFSLQSNTKTLALYPFRFVFSITYRVLKNTLSVSYSIQNTGDEEMLFSVGGHPAFKVPLVPGTRYEDYRLTFEKTETAGRWPISAEGLIEQASQPFLNNTNDVFLSKEMFSKDAVVLKHLQSKWVLVHSDKTAHGLQLFFAGFPYLGLWAATGADFLCIEPWAGIADSVAADQQLIHKEGIITLASGKIFEAEWQVRCF